MDPDTLALLEEKVQRAVEAVAKLRKERDAAVATSAKMGTLEKQIGELTHEIEGLRAERDSLKSERETVKQRLHKLLTHIDRLNTDA